MSDTQYPTYTRRRRRRRRHVGAQIVSEPARQPQVAASSPLPPAEAPGAPSPAEGPSSPAEDFPSAALALTGAEVEIVVDEPPWVAGARRVMQSFLVRFNGTTLRGYRSDLACLAEHMGLAAPADERNPDQAARDAGAAAIELLRWGRGGANERVSSWKSEMQRRGLEARTINRRLAAVRSMLRAARQLMVIDWEIDVQGAHVELTSAREGPSADRIARILVALDGEGSDESIRDVAIIRLLRIGLRRGEVSSRDLEHVRFDQSALVIRGKKRTQDEVVTLPSTELDSIRRWLEVRGREPGALFVRLHTGERMTGHDVWRMTRARGAKVFGKEEEKLAPVRPHGLRHNATVRSLDLTNGNTAAVSSLLRHRDIRIVQAYDDKRQDRGGEVAKLLSEDLDQMVANLKSKPEHKP